MDPIDSGARSKLRSLRVGQSRAAFTQGRDANEVVYVPSPGFSVVYEGTCTINKILSNIAANFRDPYMISIND
jgi:hypothetical protein